MKRVDTRLPGVCVIEPDVFGDERGYFFESFHAGKFAELGLGELHFVQANVSRSTHGVLRGLHYQWPNPQGKLVQVLDGEVFDVAVDIRQGSPTFGQWDGVMLTAANHRQFWIPPGLAHGFAVVSDAATFAYQCTAVYDPQADAGVRYDDPDIAVDWPLARPQLSAKDARAPRLKDIPPERLPRFDR